MDKFLPEKLAIKYCEQYMIERGTKEYEMAHNAFCVGFSFGATQNKVVEDGCVCTEPRSFHGNGIVIICDSCGLPFFDRRSHLTQVIKDRQTNSLKCEKCGTTEPAYHCERCGYNWPVA